MKSIIFTTGVIIVMSLSCLSAQTSLAQEVIPVAGLAIESNKNTSSEPPVAGSAIRESERRPKSDQLAFRPGRSTRRESTTQVRRRGREISRRESTPRNRSLTSTSERKIIQTRSVRRPIKSSPTRPPVNQNFPIRRG
ncbi:hypothetical protein [Nostoc sp. CENA543]|uniref:hypothetical protein n=1 Tax=Nostoc sp. CENA543 TaxID=1869241 RepID=UPI0012FFDFAB|nr:hypothetical protein [Nostoc sp. CENA543]